MFAVKDEIAYAHSILLEGKADFDPNKVAIIECDESRDIKACPGSGKTTTLLAKLIILARRMPLPDNQGICVLTHTNVAIDEIKAKLGSKADILFSYPNHFGTIQSFVDKYIGNLSMQYYYDTNIRIVDDELANKMMISLFCSLDKFHNKLHTKLYGQLIGGFREISEQEISSIGDKDVLQRLKVISLIPKTREPKYQFNMSGYKKADLRLTIKDEQVIANIYKVKNQIDTNVQDQKISTISNSYIDFVGNKVVFPGGTVGLNTESGIEFLKIKESLFKQGIIKYNEAYNLAMRLCAEHGDILQQAISSRFKYLFIDEMQDTNQLQFDIINRLFDKDKTIIQCFGDHHQAIYNTVTADNVWIPNDPLPIDCSNRFGENIAKILRTVCMEDNNCLKANSEIHSIKPILLIYEDPEKVLPEFVRLVKEKKIDGKSVFEIAHEEKSRDHLKRNNLKAVGWVGTEREDIITLSSYFKDFNRNVRKKERVNYDSLRSFLRKKDGGRVKDYSDLIVHAILHMLSLSEESKNRVNGKLRNYTRTSFIQKYQTTDPEGYAVFRTKLAKWSKGIHDSTDAYCEEIIREIQEFLKTDLAVIFKYDLSVGAVSAFIENDTSEDILTSGQVIKNNVYEQDGVCVEVGTIHSVKGETHIATLYLETSYYNKCESQRIANQLKGQVYRTAKRAPRTEETLKMAYVGMSRPRYMLCMAIHKNNFTFDCETLRDLWEVIEVS